MLRYRKDGNGDLIIPCDHPLNMRIKELAKESQTTAASWALEALEFMLHEHRAGRFRPNPGRHWERNGSDETHVVDL